MLYLQEVLAGLLLAPADSESWLQALPPPLFPGNDGTGKAVCLKGEALLSAVVSSKVCHHTQLPCMLRTPLLTWGFKGNGACINDLLCISHRSNARTN